MGRKDELQFKELKYKRFLQEIIVLQFNNHCKLFDFFHLFKRFGIKKSSKRSTFFFVKNFTFLFEWRPRVLDQSS